MHWATSRRRQECAAGEVSGWKGHSWHTHAHTPTRERGITHTQCTWKENYTHTRGQKGHSLHTHTHKERHARTLTAPWSPASPSPHSLLPEQPGTRPGSAHRLKVMGPWVRGEGSALKNRVISVCPRAGLGWWRWYPLQQNLFLVWRHLCNTCNVTPAAVDAAIVIKGRLNKGC